MTPLRSIAQLQCCGNSGRNIQRMPYEILIHFCLRSLQRQHEFYFAEADSDGARDRRDVMAVFRQMPNAFG